MFATEINLVSLKSMFLVSYDIISRVTYIFLKQSIKLIVSPVLEKETHLKISEHDLQEFEIASGETNFIFKNQFYNEIHSD